MSLCVCALGLVLLQVHSHCAREHVNCVMSMSTDATILQPPALIPMCLLYITAPCSCFNMLCSCGSGLSGEALTEAGHAWVGVDISPAMLGEECGGVCAV